MRARTVALGVVSSALAAGCAFVMDFDELQRGKVRPQTDAGGGDGGHGGEHTEASTSDSGGTGAVTSAGGDGPGSGGKSDAGDVPDADVDAAPVCDTDCADTDPCTVDVCRRSGCKHVYTPGIVSTGLSATLTAEKFHRVTMTANADRFYLTALKSTGTSYDVELHDFGSTVTRLPAGKNLSTIGGLSGMPVSAIGLAPGVGGLDLTGYVAVGTAPAAPAQVYRLRFNLLFNLADAKEAAADANYLAGHRDYPRAWSQGVNAVWAAWPGNGSGVYVHSGTNTAAAGSPPALATTGQVVALAPLATGTGPGVLYVTDRPYAQALGQVSPFPLPTCDKGAGTYTSATSAFTGVPGVWVGGWSKAFAGAVVSESLPVICGTNSGLSACFASASCDREQQSLVSVRNPDVTFFRRQGDPANRVYEAIVTPVADLAQKESSLLVQVVRADFDLNPADGGTTTEFVTPAPVSLVALHDVKADDGPDFPAVAFAGADKLAIAWLQRASDGTKDELHIEGKQICFPQATPPN